VLTGGTVEPTEVIFCDYEKSQYLDGLYQLSWLDGSRVEQKLARQEARRLLREYFPEDKSHLFSEDEESVVEYQQPDGGIGILPYASSDLALSALVACTCADRFDRAALIGYFYKTLEEEEQDHSLALLGLAALDEPVLLQIKQELRDPQLAPAVRINLATALLEMGDGSEALKVYREILKKNTQDLGNTLRIKVGKDQDDVVAATTQMAVLAARLNQAETNRLYQYILENPAAELVNFLEQIQILKLNLQRMNSEPVSFSYNLNGKTSHVSLKNGEIFRITLLPQDLPRIKFSKVRGKVGVMTRYSQPYSEGQVVSSEGLSLSRQYQVNGVKTNSLKRSDLVKVVLTVGIKDRAPGGWYEVVDILPAGLAYVPRPYDYGVDERELSRWSYPTEVKGQKLTFPAAKDSRKDTQEIIYFARVISPGEFKAEAPVISHVTARGVFIQGDEERLRIK
ncbi:MAG: alpha-2-macroglobulin, partial [Bacillota bacterium]